MLNNLENAIKHDPWVVLADTTVLLAVEQMNSLNRTLGASEPSTYAVIVGDGQQVLGLLTERDVIGLVAQQQPIAHLTLGQFLQQQSSPAASLTIPESALSDISAIVAYFEQQQATHLPLVNAQNQLIGVLSHAALQRLQEQANHQATVTLLASQQQILERIARADLLPDVLSALLQTMESHLTGTVCSIILCRNGRLADMFAPNLPPDYTRLIREFALPIAEGAGSCGTAAFRQELVVVTDIEQDPLWHDYKSLVLDYGLRACTSIPIFGNDRTVLGVLGVYYYEQKAPQALELESIAQAANIAGIAIEQAQATKALQQMNQELEARVAERTAALQASEERWQLALKGSNIGISDWDIIGNKRFYSSNWKSMRGFAEGEIGDLVDEVESRVHPDDYDRTLATLNAHLAGETEFCELEYRSRCKDGSYIWILNRGQALRDETGQAIRMISFDTDITALKQAELALKASERRYASLAAAAPVAIFRFDTSLHCVYVSEYWSELSGRPISSALGYGWMESLHPEDREQSIAGWAEDYAQAHPNSQLFHEREGRHLRPDGTINWCYIHVVQEVDDDGQVVGYIGTLTDITDRKLAEIALQESQAQFRHLTENVPGMIYRYVLFPDGRDSFTYVSSQIHELYEVAADLVMQDSAVLWAIIHPDDMPVLRTKVQESAANLMPFVLEHRLITPSGLKFAKAISRPERQQDGSIFWDGVVIDITDLKLTELALQSSQVQFRRMTENVPGMIYRYSWHPDGQDELTYVSSQVREIFEIEPEIALADVKQIWGRVDPNDLARIEADVQHSAATLEPFISEYRLNLPQRGLRWANNQSHVEQLEDGTVVWDGVVIDITDRKNAELALQDLSARLEFALKGANIGIWEFQISGGRLLWDDRMYALYGILPEEFSGQYTDWLQLIHPEDLERAQQVERESYQGVEETNVEFRIIRPDGTIRFIDSYAFNHWTEQGELQKTIGLNIDITDRKLAEALLQQKNEELARATRLKDEFLANMSHELRTPLNAILGMTEILQEQVFGELSDQQQKFLQTIENSSNHLLALINDILDVAKIEAGQIELDCQPINIEALCKSSLAFIKQQAFNKNIQLELAISPNLPTIAIDERRIRQVLINLLNNAVKFTPEGGSIILQVQYMPAEVTANSAGARGSLAMSVTDTGIGIAADQIDRLFQPFVQVDSALNRNYDGTGLGLALVKRLVELHGGQVALTSELGVGSCFEISLPVVAVCPLASPPEPLTGANLAAIQLRQRQSPVILLAEDNEANVSTFVEYLTAKGYSLVVASNGQMAIDLAQETHPALILMDIQMPGMDGLEAIQQIRQKSEFANTPIIALTALAMPGDRERCLAVGANGYLSKPVSLKQLANQISSYLI
jgi:PAS domain S-box-containing protein